MTLNPDRIEELAARCSAELAANLERQAQGRANRTARAIGWLLYFAFGIIAYFVALTLRGSVDPLILSAILYVMGVWAGFVLAFVPARGA